MTELPLSSRSYVIWSLPGIPQSAFISELCSLDSFHQTLQTSKVEQLQSVLIFFISVHLCYVLPSPCTAFFQAFSVNSLWWRIRDEVMLLIPPFNDWAQIIFHVILSIWWQFLLVTFRYILWLSSFKDTAYMSYNPYRLYLSLHSSLNCGRLALLN